MIKAEGTNWSSDLNLGFSQAQLDRNRDKANTTQTCRRCGRDINESAGRVQHTIHGYWIPAEFAADYPHDGDPIPAKYAELVAKYGPSQGIWDIGPECAKYAKGLVS